MNRATFIGNLCKDAEIKQSRSGRNFLTFDIAVNRKNKDNTAYTTYVECVKGGDNATNLIPYLKKGVKIYVEGEISARAYINRDNQPVGSLSLSVFHLELLGGNNNQQNNNPQGYAPAPF